MQSMLWSFLTFDMYLLSSDSNFSFDYKFISINDIISSNMTGKMAGVIEVFSIIQLFLTCYKL